MKIFKSILGDLLLFIILFQSVPLSAETSITSSSTIEEIRDVFKKKDLYVLEIFLENGEFPAFDKLETPEGCTGLAITNNEYVCGSLRVDYNGKEVYNSGEYNKKKSGVKVKVRGNTSSYNDNIKKKSYKIKLEKKTDLLFRGQDGLEDKEWVLLGHASNFLHYVTGFEVGRQLGLGWQPEFKTVAVIMNDEYMGSYYLCESVKGGKHRVNIDDSGYIMENDVYWWKPDEVYVKTIHQYPSMGWTFKEPDTDDFHEMSEENIKWVLNTVEQRIFAGEEVEDMIDYRSFAAWLLAHDIMNSMDPLGSNPFIFKRNFNIFSPFETKLEMGPLWDLDDAFTKTSDEFALVHRFLEHWFYKLWELPNFRKTYTDVWLEVRETIKEKTMEKLRGYLEENPEISNLRSIDASMSLNSDEYNDPEEDYKQLDAWFDQRVPVLNKLILDDSGLDDIIADTENNYPGQRFGKTKNFTLDGMPANDDSKGVVISVDSSGNTLKQLK